MDNAHIIEGEAVPVAQMSLGTVVKIPAVRQIMLLVGVAASVAAGFAIVLWSQTPSYSLLYSNLGTGDAAEVTEALAAANIDHTIDTLNGSVMVAESQLHAARLELATQGLPQSSSVGMESLKEQSTFGQSQFRENALYQHALESELARTIGHLGPVREARVHLALPPRSAFIRDSKEASASIMLSLYRGRDLGSDQAAAIVHLVASSVPNLLSNNITLIDQQGRLLSSGERQWDDVVSEGQFKLAERLERNYKRRIEDLLTPLLGPGRVRAEVVADVDFTITEETRESFDPNGVALVSEALSSSQRGGTNSTAQGIPGALSNQPPVAGAVADAEATESVQVNDTSSSSTRNFEVDRTVSHTRPQTGTIRRLSVAVLVDDTPAVTGENGATETLTPADIDRFTALVKEAVGFDESRGDTVAIVNAAFQPEPEAIEAEPAKIWDNPVVVDSLKMILGVALVLALAFGLIRPMLKSLLAANSQSTTRIISSGASYMPVATGQLPQASTAMLGPSFDEKIAAAKNISGHDPAKVAQVVKKWVSTEEA